jgi:hypothetical protein
MGRSILIVAILSLLLAAATVTLWMRSYWVSDEWEMGHEPNLNHPRFARVDRRAPLRFVVLPGVAALLVSQQRLVHLKAPFTFPCWIICWQ